MTAQITPFPDLIFAEPGTPARDAEQIDPPPRKLFRVRAVVSFADELAERVTLLAIGWVAGILSVLAVL